MARRKDIQGKRFEKLSLPDVPDIDVAQKRGSRDIASDHGKFQAKLTTTASHYLARANALTPQALLLDDKYLYTSEWGAGAKLSRFSKTPPKAQETIGVFYQYALVHVDDKFIWLTAGGDLYRTPK